jgi:HAD superfamily hydrolase (TIGR01509 family)
VHALAGSDGHAPSPAIERLRVRLASHDLGLVKPDPAIYHEAQRRFTAPAERIVFFDDLEENVAAARAAGWRAYRIDHKGDTATQMRTTLHAIGVLANA